MDDATFSVGNSELAVLSMSLTQQYVEIADYVAANKLVINNDKTHLAVMATNKFSKQREEVQIQAS